MKDTCSKLPQKLLLVFKFSLLLFSHTHWPTEGNEGQVRKRKNNNQYEQNSKYGSSQFLKEYKPISLRLWWTYLSFVFGITVYVDI